MSARTVFLNPPEKQLQSSATLGLWENKLSGTLNDFTTAAILAFEGIRNGSSQSLKVLLNLFEDLNYLLHSLSLPKYSLSI